MRQKITFNIMKELKNISYVRMQHNLQTRNNKKVLIDPNSHLHFPIKFGNFLWVSIQFILSRIEFKANKHHEICVITKFPDIIGYMDDGNPSRILTLSIRKIKGNRLRLVTAHFGDTLEYFT